MVGRSTRVPVTVMASVWLLPLIEKEERQEEEDSHFSLEK
jgi:hypothetical protein